MTAIEQMKAHFAKALAKPVDLASYEGFEWWQLDPAEGFIFGLDVADMPALVTAWDLFEAVADIAHTEFHNTPLCIEVRAALPFVKQGQLDAIQWEQFARVLGIRGRTARAWFYKFLFAEERDGGHSFTDDDMPMPRPS